MAHRTESHRTTSLEKRPALIQRSEIIPLFNPDDPKRPFIMVRVRIEKGMLYIQSQERRLSLTSKGVSRLAHAYDNACPVAKIYFRRELYAMENSCAKRDRITATYNIPLFPKCGIIGSA